MYKIFSIVFYLYLLVCNSSFYYNVIWFYSQLLNCSLTAHRLPNVVWTPQCCCRAHFTLWGAGIHCWGRHGLHAILGRIYQANLIFLFARHLIFLQILILLFLYISRWCKICFYKRETWSVLKMLLFPRVHMWNCSLTQRIFWTSQTRRPC